MEWDDITRGRHNGCVNGYKYFETTDNLNSGTLLKIEKANFGVDIFEAIQ